MLYLASMRLPTERAHGLQIMKTCEAFMNAGAHVTLAVPTRKTDIREDAFAYYGIATRFPLVRLFAPDTVSWGRVGFLCHMVWFSLHTFMYILRTRPGVVYSRDALPLFLPALFGFSVVWESHQGSYTLLARMLLRKVLVLVVISEGLREWYVARHISKERILVAHDAIDPDEFSAPCSRAEARRILGLAESTTLAMYIGSLEEWKGYRTFLECSTFLPDVTCAAIGGNEEQVRNLSKEFPRVRFLGTRPYRELSCNQRAADVLVVPNTGRDILSARFTSPLKVFAHMASGVPIVASDVPSMREILSEDTATFVVPDDPQALAEGIRVVLQDSLSAHARTERARKEVVAYTWDARAEHIMSHLR